MFGKHSLTTTLSHQGRGIFLDTPKNGGAPRFIRSSKFPSRRGRSVLERRDNLRPLVLRSARDEPAAAQDERNGSATRIIERPWQRQVLLSMHGFPWFGLHRMLLLVRRAPGSPGDQPELAGRSLTARLQPAGRVRELCLQRGSTKRVGSGVIERVLFPIRGCRRRE